MARGYITKIDYKPAASFKVVGPSGVMGRTQNSAIDIVIELRCDGPIDDLQTSEPVYLHNREWSRYDSWEKKQHQQRIEALQTQSNNDNDRCVRLAGECDRLIRERDTARSRIAELEAQIKALTPAPPKVADKPSPIERD